LFFFGLGHPVDVEIVLIPNDRWSLDDIDSFSNQSRVAKNDVSPPPQLFADKLV